MVNVGVKLSDIGYPAAGTGKTADTGVKGAQSDQFRKLLQGRQDESRDSGAAQKVSEDAGQEKTEAPRKTDESKGKEPKDGEKDVKDDAQKDIKDEAVDTEDSQTQGLLAAYQMAQGLRPELLTTEPEIVIDMPEAIQAVPEESVADMAAFVEMPEQVDVLAEAAAEEIIADAIPVQEEVKPQDMVRTTEPEIQVKEPQAQVKEEEPKVQAKAAEVQTKQPEVREASVRTAAEETPVRRETVKTQVSDEEGQALTGEDSSGQSAAAPVTQSPVKFAEPDVKPQEVTTVHVAQPEELPEKLTDQLLDKMAEGVNSFEIEIEPENLGKIAVKILYEDGQATVSILCTEKKALDVLGNHAREIGGIIDRNMGGETKIYVEKQEPDYLNQNRDENQQGKQGEQEQQKEGNKKQQSGEDSEQFLQKLRLGLTI